MRPTGPEKKVRQNHKLVRAKNAQRALGAAALLEIEMRIKHTVTVSCKPILCDNIEESPCGEWVLVGEGLTPLIVAQRLVCHHPSPQLRVTPVWTHELQTASSEGTYMVLWCCCPK
jgi:hypothetical protein